MIDGNHRHVHSRDGITSADYGNRLEDKVRARIAVAHAHQNPVYTRARRRERKAKQHHHQNKTNNNKNKAKQLQNQTEGTTRITTHKTQNKQEQEEESKTAAHQNKTNNNKSKAKQLRLVMSPLHHRWEWMGCLIILVYAACARWTEVGQHPENQKRKEKTGPSQKDNAHRLTSRDHSPQHAGRKKQQTLLGYLVVSFFLPACCGLRSLLVNLNVVSLWSCFPFPF